MPVLNNSTDFTGAAVTEAGQKTWIDGLYAYLSGLFGTTGTPANARAALGVPAVNWLDNPDGAIYQRAVAATADDVYFADRWYALTQTASVTPSQLANPEDGYRFGMRLTQSQVTAQRMGFAQIVEGVSAIPLRNKTVTVGGRLRCSASTTLRFALLAWTGTEDVVTSDVVNNWASTTYTPANFFIGATLSVVATGSVAVTGAAAATFSASAAVPAGTNNLIAVVWSDSTLAQNVTLDAWGLRLLDAPALVDAARRSQCEESRLCQRHYEVLSTGCTGHATTSADFATWINWAVNKRSVPTVTRTQDSASNVTSSTIDNPSVSGARLAVLVTGVGLYQATATVRGAADL